MERKNFFDLVSKVQSVIIDSLNNQMLFKEKINLLQLKIKEIRGDTEGQLISNVSEDRFEMRLSINPKDDEKLINFVIAHEHFHLLFVCINKLKLSGYCQTDDSFSHTSIVRKSEEEKCYYGIWLEEMLCDFLSLETIYRLYDKKYNHSELLDIVYSKKSQMYNTEHYYLTKNFVQQFGKIPTGKFDAYPSCSTTSPDNILLYTAITDSLNLLVNDYDDCMGNGAWMRFNREFDKYILTSDENSKKFIDIEMQRFSMIDNIE